MVLVVSWCGVGGGELVWCEDGELEWCEDRELM